MPTKGLLDGTWGYLSGPMEAVSDNGVEWRRKFIELVDDAGLAIDLIDPTDKPLDDESMIGENKALQIELQRQGRFLELRELVSDYRRQDLRYVDHSNFVVVLVNPDVHMCGTYDELFFAESQHKPLFFIVEGGLYRLPRWLFDVVDLDDPRKGTKCNVYENVEGVVEELKRLDSGEVPFTKKWVLIRKALEKKRQRRLAARLKSPA